MLFHLELPAIPGAWAECRIKGQCGRKVGLTSVTLILLPHQLYKHSPVHPT